MRSKFEKVVVGGIIGSVVLTILGAILVIWLIGYVGCAVKEKGLKGVTESIWEGQETP